jgi:hypothetical protein
VLGCHGVRVYGVRRQGLGYKVGVRFKKKQKASLFYLKLKVLISVDRQIKVKYFSMYGFQIFIAFFIIAHSDSL